ncbi:hypothetical protein F5Y18DRAFT_248485 [Xylariaceae sp. FL1019]|nr:hypothetical protein F5Y18DRAFT_248485 [Xylariaceae sp. FL1019]
MSDPAARNAANPVINKHSHDDSSHTHVYTLQPHLTEDSLQIANSIQQQTDFPLSSSIPRPTFDFNPPAYAPLLYNNAQPQHGLPQVRQEVNVQAPPAPVLSQNVPWEPQSETLTQQSQQPHLLGGTPNFTTCAPVPQADMRYIGGHSDVRNAGLYEDGRYTKPLRQMDEERNETDSSRGSLNPKKRGRKAIQNDRPEVEEETKRARGRPRLEATEDVDLKERRKLQIRVAQRAYRERKENAISHLEAKVEGLRAANTEIKDNYKKFLLDYVHEHGIHALAPELARRLEQFQTLLNARVLEPNSPRSDGATSETKANDAQAESQSTTKQTPESQDAKEPVEEPPQPQQLLYGLTVTHEPEYQTISASAQSHDSSSSLDDSFEGYTLVVAPNLNNASFSSMSMMNPEPDFVTSLNGATLPAPSTTAYLESTFARRLHRRATESAASLIHMDNPPPSIMFQVFGFVQNYDTIDKIKERLTLTLNRGSGEDLNAYTEPFHAIGGSGTHFPKNVASPYASFAENGLGMGPFDERKMHVRDHLLDKLQRTDLPGWQGEWFDSYEVEHYLLSEGIVLPDHDGFVVLPPRFVSRQDQFPRQGGTNTPLNHNPFSQPPSDLPPHGLQRPTLYTTPVSAEPLQLSITAAQDDWATHTDLYNIHHTTANAVSPILAFDNTAFPDTSQYQYSNLMSNTPGGRRVWFSTEKFQDRLLHKATCVGRGPAFRKENIIPALLDSIRPE